MAAMEVSDKLVILKQDLQMLTDDSDAYLTTAAYLFRKRGADDTAMPRFLRYELNNLLFSQKAKEPEDGNGDDI